MNKVPLYEGHDAPNVRPNGSHTGLWYTRFFNRFSSDWEVGENKRAWIDQVVGSCGDTDSLRRACLGQVALLRSQGGKSRTFSTLWRFVTGLGLPHPVENGFTWHPTLGVPYLCGAAVKGLVRAWVETMADISDDERERRVADWFGTQEGAGQLVFFDALPIRPPRLVTDVMTPHMGKWYEKGDQATDAWKREAEWVPGDWHHPTPVPFLVVDTATFLFGIAPRSSQSSGEVDFAFEALEDSLRLLGAGAKTAVGYGHMGIEVAGLEQLERDLEEAREERTRTRELEALSPFERSLEETIANSSGQAPHVALLQALEKGAWEGDEARQVALRIRDLMVAENKWRPSSKRPNRDKDHQRTLKVTSLLKRTD